jgi:hypothetical protein
MRAVLLLAILATPAYAGDADDVAKLADSQFADLAATDDVFVKDAPVFSPSFVQQGSLLMIVFPGTSKIRKVVPSDRKVTMAGDGKSAWVTLNVRAEDWINKPDIEIISWRVSELVVKTPDGWAIQAADWTQGVSDAFANTKAKESKKTASLDLGSKPGDASLRAAFGKLTTDGLDATAAARKDLVAIGSAPNERTTGGAIHAKAWAAWKGKAKVVSSVAGVAPSGTTGWVAANVEVDKGSYKIPFLVFCVFDKTAKGEWSVVHSHFAVE